MIKRYQLFEFCDQPWIEGPIRDAFMDCLGYIYFVARPYEGFYDTLITVSEEKKKIIDLAAGNAAPIETFLRFRDKRRQEAGVPVIVHDLYPKEEEWARLKDKYDQFDYDAHPKDALQIESGEPCSYVLFSAFHHFTEDKAIELISSKVRDGSDLIIFEMTTRDGFFQYFWHPIGFFMFMIGPLFTSKWKWQKFFVLTLFPIAPFIMVFDGLVSTLRTYIKPELEHLAAMASLKTGKTIKLDMQEKRWGLFFKSYMCRFYQENT